jgi:hypothetical protein
MSAPARPTPPPGARPAPTPGPRPAPPPRPPVAGDGEDARHPAVEAAVRAMANAEALSPADQIPQYEAAYQTLRETLATIDHS